jgi:hypothetical protein
LELVIYLVLTLVLVSGVTLYVINGLRLFRGGESYQTAQRDALLALRRITSEICNSTDAPDSGGGRIAVGAGSIIFPSADDLIRRSAYDAWDFDKNGNLRFRKWVRFFHEPELSQLSRRELSMLPTVGAELPVSPFPSDFTTSTDVLASNIGSFQVAWLQSGRLLEVTVTSRVQTGRDPRGATTVELKSAVKVEN